MLLANVHELQNSKYLTKTLTSLRDRSSDTAAFVAAADAITQLLVIQAMELVAYRSKNVKTPVGALFEGLDFAREIQVVSVIRAGESMEFLIRRMLPGIKIGKVLIQRDKETLSPNYYYKHLPKNISDADVLLFEPMLATGGSLDKAISVLLESGVTQSQITCLNFLASPVGINRVASRYEMVNFVVASIEDDMTDTGYMLPGVGDFGDRYFGTI